MMDLVQIFGGPLTATIVCVLAVKLFIKTAGAKDWKWVAEDLGLQYTNTLGADRNLSGTLQGFDVVIKVLENPTLVAEIRGVETGFTLRQDNALLRMIKPDIEIGDQLFDEQTRIEGDADRALALLGDEARRLIDIVVTERFGELKHDVLKVRFNDIRQTRSALEPLLELAQLLPATKDTDIPELLIERTFHDSSQGVRLQAFRQLSSSYPQNEEGWSAAEKLLGTSSASLQLEACRMLLKAGPDRRALAVEGLVGLATSSSAASSIRRSALGALAESTHREAAIPVMVEILNSPKSEPPGIRRAALEGLIVARAKKELLEVVPYGPDETEVLTLGLGGFDVSVQPRLLQLLEHPNDRIRLAAIDSLKRVGDLSSIAALRQVAGLGTLLKSSVGRAAEHAIGEIKSRSRGSQRGEISLAAVAPLEGAISQADDSEAGGEVSLMP